MRYHPIRTVAAGIIFMMVSFALAGVSQAAEVTLAWDSHDNTHSDLTGYNLYYKASSSVQADPDGATLIYIALSDPNFDPENPGYTITGLENDTQYFFTVTAMVDDDESGMSNEVAVTNGASSLDDSNSGRSSEGLGCFIDSLK